MFKHPLLYVCIALVGLFLAGGLIRPASERPYVGQASTKAESSEDGDSRAGIAPPPTRQQGEPQAEVYSANCDRPKDHDQADLCVQRRMADAAERQNTINSWSLAALTATLIATFVAAVAAWLTVKTMRETAKRELRAYISLDTAMATAKEGDFTLDLVFRNCGQTPAHHVRMISDYRICDVPVMESLEVSHDRWHAAGTIGPGAPIKADQEIPRLTDEQKVRLANGKLAIFYFGQITYADAFGDTQRTNFSQFIRRTNISDGTVEMTSDSLGNDAT